MQSTRNLKELLEKMDEQDRTDLSGLSFASFDKVQQVLAKNHNLIQLKAPVDGVILFPPHSNDDKSGRVDVGGSVKSGQSLATVGNLDGIRVEIEVPEIDVSFVKPGISAKINSVTVNRAPLTGEITAVSAQAASGNSGGMPSFSAIVEVKSLTAAQKWVKVGMSANVDLIIDNGKKLVIPTSAIQFKQGQPLVVVRNKDGSKSDRSITTGTVEAGRVIVERGLNPGDRLVINRVS